MSLVPDLVEPLKMVEREIFGPKSNRPSNQLVPWEFFQPWHNIFRPLEQLSNAMNRMNLKDVDLQITSDSDKFQVNIDVQHFAPEEVTVKVINGFVIVEGKHEEKRDEHGYISRRFVRRYALPKGCLPDTVKSTFSTDGVLTVTAPKVLPLPSTGERIVPITHTGPFKK
ncbi:protein lethal(2)essential for life-like [Leptidea sinapis]|uniref:protein lethal(2)essential for life-like n=1 Tax=Leptidea sinapis TaxID=189913 RepID=UPI0021C42A29|nr:protein lethal(2)essential for life-like [Leptidea sinapis]